MKILNQSNIFENEALINLDGPMSDYLTFVVIPECDVFLTMHRVEAGEPFGTSDNVARTSGVNEPYVTLGRPPTCSIERYRMSKRHNAGVSKLRSILVLSHLFRVRENTKHKMSHKGKAITTTGKAWSLEV